MNAVVAQPSLFTSASPTPAPAPSAPAAAPPSASAPAPAPSGQGLREQQQGGDRPVPAPAAKIRIGDAEFETSAVQEALAAKAAETSRKLTLPQAPDGYKAELPADFKLPEGVSFEFNVDDPLLAQGRQLMHDIDNGRLSGQEAFSKMLALHAATQVESQATISAARNSEIEKLGVNGPARVDAVTNWLKAVGGNDAETLIKVMDYAPVAGTVMAFENLMRKFSSQGAGGFSQRHRERPNEGPTEEEWASWSFGDRRTYTTTGQRPGR